MKKSLLKHYLQEINLIFFSEKGANIKPMLLNKKFKKIIKKSIILMMTSLKSIFGV